MATGFPDDTCGQCGAPLVCSICESCAEHCNTEGGPWACWEAHEKWRKGDGDPTFAPPAHVTYPVDVLPAPEPRIPRPT